MTTLRDKIIRLAHANPELRPHLLPILWDDMSHTVKVAVEARGAVQKAIVEALSGFEQRPYPLTALASHPEFRGVHFKRIMSAVAAMKKAGLVVVTSDPHSGYMVHLASPTTKSATDWSLVDDDFVAYAWRAATRGGPFRVEIFSVLEHGTDINRMPDFGRLLKKARSTQDYAVYDDHPRLYILRYVRGEPVAIEASRVYKSWKQGFRDLD